ncbi:MAG: hypothetical protein IPK58_11340 [Acidobacteria bacterium]|nr:hypothetical protein [Acidobacteriota bacterium]
MMKLKLTAVLSLVALLAACAGASKLDVKVGNKDMPLNVKGSGTYSSTKTFTETKDGQSKITKAASNYVVLANYDIDTSSGMNSMGKAVTAADQIRVSFQLVGEEGTDDKTGFKTGTYTTKAEKFAKVDYVNIAYFADGKESSNSFDGTKSSGEIKITSVSADAVSGEINLTEGDKQIKGSFTAKIPVKK